MPSQPAQAPSRQREGFLFALSAYLFWGFAPLYFVAMEGISAFEIIIHRTLWSFVFLGLWIHFTCRWGRVREIFANRTKFIACLITGPVVALNWLIFIFAVEWGRISDASLGYFLNPLVVIVAGMFIFGEKLTIHQVIAVGLAAIGVGFLTVVSGVLPYIALSLAVTFTIYGVLRKKFEIPPTAGLWVETLILLPFAAIALGLSDFTMPQGASFGTTVRSTLLLIGIGIITVLPLVWYNSALRLIAYKYMGFMQFIGPTIMFALAIFLLGEPLDTDKLIAFSLIWSGLAVFVFGLARGRG